MSAALSARRTCSGPDTRSTIRAGGAAAAGSVAAVSPGRSGWAAVSAFTRACPTAETVPSVVRFCPAAAGQGIELKAMPDQFVAELVGDQLLQLLDLLVTELDDAA